MQLHVLCKAHRRMSLLRIKCLIVIVFFGFSTRAWSAFSQTETLMLSTPDPHNNITFDGSRWYIAQAFGPFTKVYQSNFAAAGSLTLSGFVNSRGATYDVNSGHLFIGDFALGLIREVTTAGVTVAEFSSMNQIEGLTFDPRDNTLWIAYFNSIIERRTRSGQLLSSFTTSGLNWASIAIDPIRNTLLMLEDDDRLFEYSFDGKQQGVPIPNDVLLGNGLGIYYNPAAGRLHTTTQEGRITVFTDVSRIPEPAIGCMGVSLLFLRRCRERA